MNELTRMRTESGEIKTDDGLVVFLYLLGRDELPLGNIEQLVDQVFNKNNDNEFVFTNGWLAKWAMDAAKRIYTKNEHMREPTEIIFDPNSIGLL